MFNKIRRVIKKRTPEEEEEYFRQREELQLDHKDRFAMFVSAFLVIILPCLAILTGICFFALWLFGAI